MLYLKQSTASQSVLIGPFVDDTDGATAETGLTIANTDIRLSKNGGNLAAKTSGGGTHDEAGWYTITLDATDTNTVGRLQLHVKVAGALMVHHEFQVLEEAVYDAMYATNAAGPLQSTTAGRTLDVTATGAAGIDWGNVENPNTAVDLSATDIQLCDTTTTNTDMITAAAVNAEVDTALADVNLDHLVGTAAPGNAPAGTYIDILADDGTATYDRTTDSLQAVRDHVGDGSNLTEAGGTGDHLTAINLPNQTMDIVGNITGNLSGSVGSVTGAVGSVTGAVGSVTGHTNQTGDTFALANGAAGFVAIDTVVDAIKVVTDALTSAAAAKLALTTLTVANSTINDASATTTTFITNLTEATDDHYNGLVIAFTDGALLGQKTEITDYDGTTKTLTVTALTEAPADGDAFVIL